MKNFKVKWLLLSFILSVVSINISWAGSWFNTGMWQVYGYNPNTKTNGWHWTGIGYGNHCEVGVITSSEPAYTFKGLGVNTSGDDVSGVHCHFFWPDGTNSWDLVNYSGKTGTDKYWEKQNMMDYTIDKTAEAGNYSIGIDFYLNSGGSDYDKVYGAIKWTISGFADGAPSSQSFGTAPTNSETEATISFTHYGNALTTSRCSISGTNSTEFEVRSISESGVTVVFKPSSNGSKTAKLTINDGSGLTYSTININLTGTAGTSGTVTRLYFNDYQYSGAGNWAASSAKYRFTCTYTSGVVTRYNMTKCDNTEHTYYADVDVREGKTVSIDRYNPASPYVTWNTATPTSPALSSANPYAKSQAINTAYATSHPYNDVTGGTVYYDNSQSGITNTKYLVVGHDHNIANDNSSTYSVGYQMTNITNTKLSYHTFSSTEWHDADYYAVVGATSNPSSGGTGWGTSLLSSKGTGGYTAAYQGLFGLLNGNTYLITATAKNGSGTIDVAKDPTFNSNQTVNTVVKTTGTYSSANSKAPITLGSYSLNTGTKTASSTSGSISTSQSTANVSGCKTATTTLTVNTGSLATGYQFDGWYTDANGGSELEDDAEYTYETTGAKTVYARFSAINYNVTYSAPSNGDYTIQVASGSASSATMTAIIEQTISIEATPNAGYAFESWTITNTSTSADVTATLLGDGSDDASTTFTMPAYGVTITARFVVRYGLYGSLDADGDPAEGMPGWSVSKDFTYNAGTGTYTCNTESLTKPNNTYKFRILDRRDNFSYGLASKAVIAANTATRLTSGDADAQLATAGRGSYTFTVVEADEGAHPQVTISNPTSYQVHFGTRAFTRDGDADKGGTVTVSDAASDGNTYADGKYIARGETVYVTASGTPTGYNFAGWWDNSSYTGNYFATANPTNWEVGAAVNAYAKFAAKECTITFDKNGGEGGATGTTGAYDAAMVTITPPHKIGYAFGGYYDAETDGNGSGTKYYNADGTSAKAWDKDTESATTLYANWTADAKTFKADAGTTEWATGSNWAGGSAPSNDYSSVTINGEVVLSTSVHIGELSFGDGGKLTIEPTGVLEVAGTITNDDASKIVINTTSSSQGALIYDISETAPHATVNLTTENTGSGFQFIASPIGSVSVSDYFAGSGVYTYAWVEGKGWDHRGYYEDFSGDEVIVLSGSMSGCTFSGQLNPTTSGSIKCSATVNNAQGVNMIPNTLTAPIKIAAMNLSDAYEGAVHIWNKGAWTSYPYASCGATAVIPALQGYAVLTEKSSGSVSFDYDVAVRGAATHNDALKAPKRTATDTPDYMTISVTTNDRKIDLQLSENEQFSNAIDKGWEALYMEGDGRFGELYAQATEPMSILATDNLEGTVLGFVPGQAENYTISFEGDGKGYYLNDVKMEVSTLIEEGNTYEFAADESTNATRFVISKMPIHKVPTGVDAISDGAKARKQLIDGVLYVIRDGRLYNTTGALVK